MQHSLRYFYFIFIVVVLLVTTSLFLRKKWEFEVANKIQISENVILLTQNNTTEMVKKIVKNAHRYLQHVIPKQANLSLLLVILQKMGAPV